MRRGLARRGTCLALLGALLVAFLGVGVDASVAAAVTSPGIVVPVAGAPLDGVVISASDVAFSSNPTHNEIEVLDVATSTLESPISIGTTPGGLDLSPDGSTLYVTEPAASQIAVIDVASRLQVGTITIPAAVVGVLSPEPVSVAVADTGNLLVSTYGDGGGALLEVDPVSGATKVLDVPLVRLDLAASGDRSHIGVLQGYLSTNEVWMYTAATDSLSAGTYIGPWVADMAMNNDGTALMAGSWMLNDSMTITGTVAAAQGNAVAFSPSGSTVYSVSGSQVTVIDAARQLETATLELPEPSVPDGASVAVSPDGSALVVTSQSGFSIAPVSAAKPVPTCTPTVTGSGPLVIHTCGGPLGGIVADQAGHIFASNPALNEIEVLDVATGTLEAPIPVGSQPTTLVLSADGSTLYVGDDGGEQISVVNVAQRVETSRITAVANQFEVPLVSSIAVANNGEALVSTADPEYGTASPLFEVNLQTGVTRQVSDPNEQGVGTPGAVLAASGDGSEIAINQWLGEIALYHAATDSFSPIQIFPNGNGDMAMNTSGNVLLVDPTSDIPNPATLVVDGSLNQQGTVPGAGTGLTISPDGTTAYRADDDRVDVINMATQAVIGIVALPESVGAGTGLVTLSSDGSHLAVLTASGISLVSTAPSPQARPTLTSTLSPTSGVYTNGVTDTVVLAGSSDATGTITFSLWGPEGTADVPCAGTPRFVATQAVNGDGTYSSATYWPSLNGYYSWVAEYTGDVANAVAGPTPCGGAGSTISIGIPHMTLTIGQNVRSGIFPLPVTYTYKVANDGDDPLQGVSVTDSACGPVGFASGTVGPGGQLQPGSAWTFSCSHTFTQPGTFTGAASVAATDHFSGPWSEAVSAVGADTVQVNCGQTISGVVNHALTVGPAATCLEGAQVHGNVTVMPGGALYVSGSIISGAVGAAEPADFVMCGSYVTSEVVLELGLGTTDLGHPGIAGNPIAPPCPGNDIRSSVVALFNLGGLNLTGNTIGQSVFVGDTSGGLGAQVGNNQIAGALWCAGNTPSPNDGALPNTVRGARYGQCSSPSF